MKEEKTPLKLTNIPREIPFTVPEEYFEQFALNIDKQIAQKRSVRSLQPWMYAAAIFVGVVAIGVMSYIWYTNHQESTSLMAEDYYDSLISADISEDLLVEYILNE